MSGLISSSRKNCQTLTPLPLRFLKTNSKESHQDGLCKPENDNEGIVLCLLLGVSPTRKRHMSLRPEDRGKW